MSKESEFTETTGPEPQNAPKAAGSARKRATLKINTLEPRILLSATMVEAESTEVAEEAALEEFYADSDASLVVKGTDGVDWLNGSDKNDLFIGGRGNDNLSGGDGDDQFVYREGDGADRYTGGSGKDVINATEAKTLELQRFQAVNSIESIFGGSEGLSIVGSKGNDVLDFSMTTLEHVTGIDAGDGNDTVIGSAGDDVIIGGRGNDNLSGGDGDDQFVYREGDGADRYTGGSGKDVINATEAKTLELQRFQAVNSIESIFGGSEGLSIVGSKGNDVLDFSMTTLEHVTGIDAGDGNDTVIGSAGDDVIIGGRGNDNLSGGDGDDQFVYREGDGADRYTGGSGKDVINATEAKTLELQRFQAVNSIESIFGGSEGLSIVGSKGNDVLDFSMTTLEHVTGIDAGDGNDTVIGSAGDDVIIGGRGNDNLSGGDGDDQFVYREGDGADRYTGGSGKDVINATEAKTLELQRFQAVNSIESIFGGSEGLSIVGSKGNDVLDFSMTTLEHVTGIDAGDGNDTVIGSAGDDVIIGGRGNDNLSGGDGDDQFVYREGDGADRYTGGSGKDVINATEAKTLELQRFQAVNSIESIFGGSEGLSIVGSKGNDVLDFSMTTLEHVTGIDAGDGNDTVIGSAGDDVIIGGRGNDNLSGGDGDDQFVYREGDGADRYTGGSGKDVINATEAKTLELQRFQAVNSIESIFGGSEGLSIVGSKGNDVLDFSMTTLEHVTGIDAGDGNDTVIGSAGDDVIIGGRGNDNLSGGDGDDQFVYREGDGADRYTGGSGKDVINATEAKTLELQRFQAVNSIESIFGGSEGLSIVGSKGNDVLDFSMTTLEHVTGIDAGDGNDTVIGSAGDDVIIGGRGNDNLSGGDGDDQFVYREGDGADRYTGGSGKDVINATEAKTLELQRFQAVNSIESIFGGSEGLSIVGSKGNDVLDFSMTTLEHVTGIDAGDGNDTVIGSAGDDVIIGGRGNDNLSGGDGDDQFVYREGDGADRYTGGSGKDVINATEAKTLELQRFQAVNSIESIFGGSEGLSIVGSKGNDVLDFSMTTLEHVTGIDAGDGNDTVIGSAGDDVIIGGRGNDNLSGGDGDDQFVYREGDGADRYTGGSGKDVINATEAKTLELQRFQAVNSIESIFGGSEGLSIVGSKGNDVLDFSMTTLEHVTGIDAGDGNDTVIGSAGDDVIIGGRGNDNLSGGDGDDLLVLSGNRADYKIVEQSNGSLSISDIRDSDGNDRISGFERYQFADQTVEHDELFNSAPTSIKIDGDTISESAEAGTIVGKLWASDEDRSDKHEYTLVDKNGKEVKDPNFEIRDNVIVVRDGHQLNYETSATQELYVQVTDSAGASFIKSVEINIGDSNDTPTDLHFSGDKVSENAEAGTVVGKLWASDEDRSDKHEYTLVDKNGKEVKDPNFEIRDNVIVVRDGHQLNYETSATQELYVQVTDSAGASFIKSIEINIGDANEVPVAISAAFSGLEDESVIIRLTGSDVDAGDSIVQYRIDALPEHGRLLFDGSPVEIGTELSAETIESGRLVFIPEKDWNGTTNLTFSAFDGDEWSASSAQILIDVAAVADGASLSVESAQGFSRVPFPLEISAATLDADGSEQLAILISGLPDGAILSAGQRQSDGNWVLAPSDLPNLTLTLDSPQSREFDLNVAAITSEANGDTSETNQQIHVKVNVPLVVAPVPVIPSDSDPAGVTSPNSTVTESNAAAAFVENVEPVAGPEQRSNELPDRPIETFIPVGDLIALIRQQPTDWSEFVFGEVEPAEFVEGDREFNIAATSESSSDQVESVATVAAAETTTVEAVSTFAWLWGAVRAFAGTRDERNEFSNNRRR